MKIEKLNGGYSDSLNVGDIVTPKHKPGAAWTVERIKPFIDAALMDESRPLVYFKTESGEKSCWLLEKLFLTSHSELQALAQLESIREMVGALREAKRKLTKQRKQLLT